MKNNIRYIKTILAQIK